MKLAKLVAIAAGTGVFIGLLGQIDNTPLRAGIALTVVGLVAALSIKTTK